MYSISFATLPSMPFVPIDLARLSAGLSSPAADGTGGVPLLRQCQRDCLDACAKGARVLEMACGTGKTRVIQELVSNVSGRVLWTFLDILMQVLNQQSFLNIFEFPSRSNSLLPQTYTPRRPTHPE
jgi:hypothetical protein